MKSWGIYWIGWLPRVIRFWREEKQITPNTTVTLYYAKSGNLENYTAALRWPTVKEARQHLIWSLRFLYHDKYNQVRT